MKIHFLGTSHGITEKDRFTSSVAIEVGKKAYVIDAGAPIMKLLQEEGIAFSDIAGIFITHSHCDHYLGLVEFMNQIECFKEFAGIHVCVHAPKLFPFGKMREFLFGEETPGVFTPPKSGGSRKEDGGDGQRITCEIYEAGEIFNDGTVRITAIKTMHTEDSHALLLEAEGKKILFTGDLRVDLQDFPEMAFSEYTDLVITEAAHPLLNSESAVRKLSGLLTDKLVITHVCPFRNTEEILAEAKQRLRDKKLSVVSDGTVIEI